MAEQHSKSSLKTPEFSLCYASAEAREFCNNICQYNAALAFVSLGADIVHTINDGKGPYVFWTHGGLYHLAGSLLPAPDHQPSYAQLYVYDPDEALRHRSAQNLGLSPDLLRSLAEMLEQHHQYARVYQHSLDVLAQYGNHDIAIRLRFDPTTDRRQYNLPVAHELAVIIPGTGDEAHTSRDLILWQQYGKLVQISDCHPAYACLHYVLLFPFGTHGWHPHIPLMTMRNHSIHSSKSSAGKSGAQTSRASHRPPEQHPDHSESTQACMESEGMVSQTRFYAFQIQVLQTEFSTILHSGKLFQQYIVDMWAATEQNHINYIRFNQREIRSALYSGLQDMVNVSDSQRSPVDLHQVGQCIILPASFQGSPRHWYEQCQDALAICREERTIDLFITVTCNPVWCKNIEALFPGQTAADHPDIVARVFHLKQKVLGCVSSYVYSNKWQKRGLPHFHSLFMMKAAYKLHEAANINSCIRAYWPDPKQEPALFQAVHDFMVHRLCGAANLNAPCMQNRRCSKGFPWPFQPYTTMDEDGYPLYYRPDDGATHLIDGTDILVDNQWIIPYNPYLLVKYQCHINVESASSFATVKYLNKYINKEAAACIYHFELHGRHPAVICLQVHLPGEQVVTFNPETETVDTVMEWSSHQRTMLTAFFELNRDPGEVGARARHLTYPELPREFVWDQKAHQWQLRKVGHATRWMYNVSISAQNLWALRLLLTLVRGPTFFEHLRTVNGITYSDFRSACLALGLLDDNREYYLCLSKVAFMQTGSQLQLWATYASSICDDLWPRLQSLSVTHPSDDELHSYGLLLIDEILCLSGHSLCDFPSMPLPSTQLQRRLSNHYIAEVVTYNPNTERSIAQDMMASLNAEQRCAFDSIVDSVLSQSDGIFFLSGGGSTGKTYLYNTICRHLCGTGAIVLCVASSGIASLLLPGGQTAHSHFKIPVQRLTEDSVCSIPKEDPLADLLRSTSLIIWDEATMQHQFAFEALDHSC
ncbi:hypothetical protein NUW54_g662 [Trametes sanguinea]|uniref:Uncharacterized protein n=1 Tax=Trametes sanguinea TaxID=158606 RepID=A0ACC1Q8K0_9APHY|nr:hypothetical protein NUW54_g662 [Trametes sanguinea]